jgi:hypothetical protein
MASSKLPLARAILSDPQFLLPVVILILGVCLLAALR